MEVRASEVIKVNVAQGIFTISVTPEDCHEIISQINTTLGSSFAGKRCSGQEEGSGLSGLLSAVHALPVGKTRKLSHFRQCFTVICFCMLLHTEQSLRSS